MAELITLPLTLKEAGYLRDALDMWNQGYEETKEDIIVDPTLENAADLLLAYSTATDDVNLGKSIQSRLELKIQKAAG